MRLPEQVRRLGIVIGVLVAVILVGRFVLIPRSLVSSEMHRSAAVAVESTRPIKHAGSATCQSCHDDVAQKKQQGWHRGLACEGCHGAAAAHADDPDKTKPAVAQARKVCRVCHAYDPSRPTGFPQIDPVAHNPMVACVKCHNAHEPGPPRPPNACSACHAQIEHTKAVSRHSVLPCTTCHQATDRHRTSPRTALPTKPQSRDFCAQCHAKNAPRPDAPKIDVGEHGGAYLCWQCHYPHMPRGRA